MRKLFSLNFWKGMLWRVCALFAWWFYIDPGFITNYFPYIFMYQVFKGTAEDAAMNLIFAKTTTGPPLTRAISVYAFDKPMYIQLAYDGANYSSAIEIPIGKFFHFSQTARAARVYNKTAGQNARFQFIAWYIISEY